MPKYIDVSGKVVDRPEAVAEPEQPTFLSETLKAPARILGKTAEALGGIAEGVNRGLATLGVPEMLGSTVSSADVRANPMGGGFRAWGHKLAETNAVAPEYQAAHPYVSNAGKIAEDIAATIPQLASFAIPAVGPAIGVGSFTAGQYNKSYESGLEAGLADTQAAKAAVLPAVASGIGASLFGPVARAAGKLIPAATDVAGVVAPTIAASVKRGVAGTAADAMLMQTQAAGVAGVEKITGARPTANATEEVWKNPEAWASSLLMGGAFRGLTGIQKGIELKKVRAALSNPEYPVEKRMLAAEKVQNALEEAGSPEAEQFGTRALDAINNKQAIPFGTENVHAKVVEALTKKVANPDTVDLESEVAKALAPETEVAPAPMHDSLTFSVSRGEDPATDAANTKKTMEFMDQHGIEYNKVQGMYEGNGEESFVLKNTPKNAEIVQKFAEKFNQDSVLHTDKEGNANLIFKDRKEPIGKVREITPEEAKGMTAYTFDPASGKYYSTQEPQNAISNGTREQGSELQGAGQGNEEKGTYREQSQTEVQGGGTEANNSNRSVEGTRSEIIPSMEPKDMDEKLRAVRNAQAQAEQAPARTEAFNNAYLDMVANKKATEAPTMEPAKEEPAKIETVTQKEIMAPGEILEVAKNMAVRKNDDGTMTLVGRNSKGKVERIADAEIGDNGKIIVDYTEGVGSAETRHQVDAIFDKLHKEKKFAMEENASGESAASLEAIRRNGNEPPRLRFDTRNGNGNILRGVDAVDFQPGAYEVVLQRVGRDGEMAVISQGNKVTDAMRERALAKYRASVTDMAGTQESSPNAGIALSNPSKKVIGLDIDGVFNTNAEGGKNIDPARVIEFNKILNQNGNPDVVLGSTWREAALVKNDITEAQKIIDSLGIKARVVGVTPDLGGDANTVSRGSEYKAWEDAYGKKNGTELAAVLDDRVDLTELGDKHIKTEGGLNEDNMQQLAEKIKLAPALDRNVVQKAFPKSAVEETPEGFKVKTPGGAEMLIQEKSVILMTPRERVRAEAAYGRELKATEHPIATMELGLDSIMSLTPQGIKAIDHEKWHWAEYAVLNDHELDIVSKKYATEEARADAYQEYVNKLKAEPTSKPTNAIETLWQKMVDFYQKIKGLFMMTPEKVFSKVTNGEVEQRLPYYGKIDRATLEQLRSLSETPKTSKEAWTQNENAPVEMMEAKKFAVQDIAKPIMESKFVEDDVKPKVVAAISNFRDANDQARRAYAPGARSEAAFQTQAEFRNVLGEMWNKQFQAATKIDKIMKDVRGEVSTVSSVLDMVRSQGKTLADTYFSKMPEGEQHDFMARMDAGRGQIDAPRQALADFMKDMFDSRVEAIQNLGTGLLTNIQTGEGENPFFPRYWERGEEAMKAIYSNISKRPIEGGKAFAKQRVFDDIYQGIEAGYKLVSNNPMDLFFMKIGELDRYISTHQMLQSLESDGLARLVPVNEGMEPGEVNILGTYGSVKRATMDENGVPNHEDMKAYKYAVKEDVAQVINNYLSQNLYNNKYVGRAFAGYMSLANNLNQMQLGVGSMFHAGFTSLEAVVSHSALGIKAIFNGEIGKGIKYLAEAPAEFIRNPMIGNKVLAAMADPTAAGPTTGMNIPLIAENAILAGARKGMDIRFQTHTTEKMFEAWANGNKTGAAIRAPFAMIEQMARPLMEWLVPRQKFGVFADMSSFWMNEHPNASFVERREAMQEIWNRVDSRLGQVVYDRLFVNNVAKNLVQGAIRAPGWTGGTILEIVGGVKDVGDLIKNVAQGKKPNMSDRTAYTLSLVMTTMIANGMLTALFTGEQPEGKDFVAFRTGNVDEHGFEERFMLPTYMKDILAYSEAPGTTLLNKIHPALGIARDILQNKDYYRTEIRHEGDNIVEQASQLVGFTAKQYQPFWMRGLQKEQERGGTAIAMGAPFIGIMPAPSDLNRTPAEKMIRRFVTERMPKTTKTEVEFERSKMLTKLTSEFRQGNPDAENDLHEAIANGTISTVASKRIKNEAKLSPIESGFKRLSLDEARKVMEKATPEEQDKLGKILKTKEAHFKKLYPHADENPE